MTRPTPLAILTLTLLVAALDLTVVKSRALAPVRAEVTRHPRIFAVERDIAALPYEVGVGYDRHGHVLWRVRGSENGYAPTGDQDIATYQGGQTHNHPGEGACVTLSIDDVAGTVHLRLAWIRAVSVDWRGRVYAAVIFQPWRIDSFVPADVRAAFRRNAWRGWCSAWSHAWQDLFGVDYAVYHDG